MARFDEVDKFIAGCDEFVENSRRRRVGYRNIVNHIIQPIEKRRKEREKEMEELKK